MPNAHPCAYPNADRNHLSDAEQAESNTDAKKLVLVVRDSPVEPAPAAGQTMGKTPSCVLLASEAGASSRGRGARSFAGGTPGPGRRTRTGASARHKVAR